ncbi:MAG TPA: (2Fe-2S)-binding protein [Pyrinomonadaceae bacterium]|nr:(2Fe-2S)-binding protein [Pyrinomonadaceae bacterium]
MSFYPPKIAERCCRLEHCGSLAMANAIGTGASFECGAFIRIFLLIDESESVRFAKYRTNGCGFMVAAAEVLTAWLGGKELSTLGGMTLEKATELFESQLGKLPENRIYCTAVVVEAAKSALNHHRARRIEEFQGEKALVCTCFGVSEETIAKVINEHDLTDVSDVSKLTRAGSGCGACQMLIRELVDIRFD